MAALDTAQFFARTLIPTIGTTHKRVPFTFTSTKRLRDSGLVKTIGDVDMAKITNENILKQELAAIDKGTTLTTLAGETGLSAAAGSVSHIPIISMLVNPNSVKWSQPKRWVKRDTREGSVFFHFTNQAGQNNDILTLTFTGNTGNINTQHGIDVATALGSDLKLRIWHELYKLTREPVLLDGNTKNIFYITYRTVLMPMQITFAGFFNSVLEFTENASSPFNRDYSFGFTVTNTSPALDDLVDRINSALAAVGPISATRSLL